MTGSNGALVAVRMIGIEKAFGGVRALKGVSLEVRPGEIHALVGENGAGKSTVLKVLRGVYRPDDGEVEIFGERVKEFTPQEARDLGVSMIFQELSLISTMTIAENVFLDREPKTAIGFIDDREAERLTRELCDELGIRLDPRTVVGTLSTGHRQLIEIVKALSQHARVLILDEPTSALTTSETDALFTLLRHLADQGVAVIYVSHRLDEVRDIAQRVTVLRDGANVITGEMAVIGPEGVVRAIVGRDVSAFERVERSAPPPGLKPILEAEDLAGERLPVDVSFTLYPGEILGIGGLMGSGRTELARVLAGVDAKRSGTMRLDGKAVDFRFPGDAVEAGIALIPEDRVSQGLVLDHSIVTNISLPILRRLTRRGLIDDEAALRVVTRLVDQLQIKTTSPQELVRRLSGGNQQKVVLSKWLAADPRVLVLDEPTAGVDIGSKAEIIALIRELADANKAIIVVSSELPEMLALSDRILVMANGRITREVSGAEISGWIGRYDTIEAARTYAEEQLTLAIQGVSQL
ncbi:MAG TPA: sugar ABC transporter ATP-binding protein [Acidimicrobiia bacterium]|nr:sugar ABC transporter ATP-binding protein [Acidimicrobiia bacterium]